MNFPDTLKYHREHTWLKLEGDKATIGITEFAQSELGEIVYVDLPNIGSTYKQDEVFGTVEAVKTVSDLFLPVTGEIVENNAKLNKEPTLVNSDPFGEGWMIKIKITNSSELNNLLTPDQYKSLTGQ
jgi:glycine cleavage system H protein